VIGAELQHYQDADRVDLTVAMEGVVAQLMALLTDQRNRNQQPRAGANRVRSRRHSRKEL